MRTPRKPLAALLGMTLAATLALLWVPTAQAVSSSAKASFVTSAAKAAQAAQRQYGIPASVSIAEAILASDYGTSSLVSKAKNYFDARCTATMTTSGFHKLAVAQVGKPYVLGAEASASDPNPPKFDCSELVEWLYARSGNKITDLAAAQYNATSKVTGSPQVGDLVFLRNNPARSNGIGHVAVLTEKLSNGDWRIIESKGRAYGTVKTTLSYWKTRKYYAGIRRLSSFALVGQKGVILAAARNTIQSGCISVTSGGSTIRYRSYSSMTKSFLDHAREIAEEKAYSSVRSKVNDLDAYIDALAAVASPSSSASYAKKLKALIDDHDLTSYDVVPLNRVLDSGDKNTKVTAVQHLLKASGQSVTVNGNYDSSTVKAVKAYQKAKKLTVDGEAGPQTITSLTSSANLKSGSSGAAVSAAHVLLAGIGLSTSSGSSYGSDTVSSMKSFQASNSLSATGTTNSNTWAKLFMTVDSSVPTISGSATVGSKLSAKAGTWGPGTVELSYQWLRGGKAISKATSSTYTLTADDAGQAIAVTVTGTRSTYAPVSRTSAATTVKAAALTSTPTPTISGSALVAQVLSAKAGTWGPGTISLAYQWYRGSTAIKEATKSTYTLTGDDLGSTISVAVTGSRQGYTSATTRSKATAKVTAATITSAPSPTISGKAVVDSQLTAKSGTWAPGSITLSYQWYRGSTAIKGATKSTYTVAAADVSATLKVKVTGTKTGYNSKSATSKATAKIARASFTTKGKASISGTAKVGKKQTAKAGTWRPSPKLSYQWYRGSTAIKGATKSSYTTTRSDKGRTITVKVKATRNGYTSVTVSAKRTIS